VKLITVHEVWSAFNEASASLVPLGSGGGGGGNELDLAETVEDNNAPQTMSIANLVAGTNCVIASGYMATSQVNVITVRSRRRAR
jgi:hypothetical protein